MWNSLELGGRGRTYKSTKDAEAGTEIGAEAKLESLRGHMVLDLKTSAFMFYFLMLLCHLHKIILSSFSVFPSGGLGLRNNS